MLVLDELLFHCILLFARSSSKFFKQVLLGLKALLLRDRSGSSIFLPNLVNFEGDELILDRAGVGPSLISRISELSVSCFNSFKSRVESCSSVRLGGLESLALNDAVPFSRKPKLGSILGLLALTNEIASSNEIPSFDTK